MRIECHEKCTVINEFAYEELDVFFENSKVHDQYVLNGFVITSAKIAKNLYICVLLYHMDFSELIIARQSDRKYLKTPVEREHILKCLEAARLAPSACNSQPWHFVVVTDEDKLISMAEAAVGLGMNKFTRDVPVMVAVVLEKMNFTAKVGSLVKNKDYCMLDLGIAVEHFCLQATDLGLGTCIMGWFDEKRIASLLGVPRGKRIPLIISLGYTDSPVRAKVRKSLDEMSSWNTY